MVVNGYTSRTIPSADAFESVYIRRIEAKRNGDSETAETLKLVINTTYGATLDEYNKLYDPLMARSVCISGQLYLLELAEHMVRDIEGLEIVQLNTDGIMVKMTKNDEDKACAIALEWQIRTKFGMELDTVKKIAQKDVNNYVMIDGDDHVKAKGGYVVRGIAKAGAFNVNNNACIVAEAIQQYLLYGTDVKQTIEECNDPFKFQLIAKAGSSYDRIYQLIDGKEVEVQRVNRVFATADEKYGTIYKQKPDGSISKIASLPEHCIVDNANQMSINLVDKSFYIEMALKRVEDFTVIKERRKRKMATAKEAAPAKVNIYRKLSTVRLKFLNAGVKKSGKNMYMKYQYFTLDDIVPAALKLMDEVGLLPVLYPLEGGMSMVIYDIDDPDSTITFVSQMPDLGHMDQITPIQELGANITYMRRYLWMLALEVTENDLLDEAAGHDKPQKAKAPAAPETRQEIKKELTNGEAPAPKLQVDRLKKAMKTLLEKRPETEETLQQIMDATDNLSNISKKDCDDLVLKIGNMLAENEESEAEEDESVD